MIPPPFDYELARSVEEAIDLLGRFGEDAKLLAGGHSLIPLLRLRLARPSALVDLGGVRELSYVREDGDRIAIGALTRHCTLERSEVLKEHCPILAHTAGLIGDPQVRHRGTIGGSVAHGDPASDLPAVLVALDAEVVVRGPGGERRVGAGEFFRGLFTVDLGPQDVLTEIRVPKTPGVGWEYLKFRRRAQDWAIVGVAALVWRSNGGVSRAAVALTNMGETPIRAAAVEQALAGGAAVGEAAQAAAEGTSPPSDVMASADYRRHLARVLCRRALETALAR